VETVFLLNYSRVVFQLCRRWPASGSAFRLAGAASGVAPFVVLLGVALLSGLLACSDVTEARKPPRLVLLYSTCTVNRNYLSPYDPSVSYTPQLARLASVATVFPHHRTEAAQSGIAFASIYSGMQSPQHGVFAHPRELPDSLQLIGEVFTDSGYDPHAWLAHHLAGERLNYAQGIPADQIGSQRLQASDRRFRKILNRLALDPDYRAFMVTNFSLTHGPYAGRRLPEFCQRYPDECGALRDRKRFARLRRLYTDHFHIGYNYKESRLLRDFSERDLADFADVIELLYKASVYTLDRELGHILAEITKRGLLDSSIIAFTADHGETLYREGQLYYWGHGYQLSPDAINVPLIIHAPGQDTTAIYPGVTRSIDVFPTLAGLAGIKLEDRPGRGVDLSNVLLRGAPAPDLLAFSHSSVLSKPVERMNVANFEFFRSHFPRQDPELIWVALRSQDAVYKLRRQFEGEFEPSVYDMATDPDESADVYDPGNVVHQKMLRQLEDYRRGIVDAYRVWSGQPGELPEEEQERMLRALGYVE
jgi:arylsulfatase A-like enzyme